MFQPELESLGRDELMQLQLERLCQTLDRIEKNNPFYFNKIKKISSRDIKSLEDIKKFPFLTKDDLRDGYPYGFTCADPSEFMRLHMSSGTTGIPIINPSTRNDIRQWGNIMARCYCAAGLTDQDVIQITPSFGLFNGGFGFHYGAETLGAMIIPIGAGRTLLQLKFIRDFNVTAITAIASYPLRIIEVAEKEGFDFKATKLKVGIFGAEVWSDEVRRRIEAAMSIETFDIIGMTETGGVGLGIDCSYHNGIHVWEDDYLIEIINPETGEPVPDGHEGEMVITTLNREGLPLVRYRTRDITAILSRERCACGRTSLRIQRLKGRNDDMLKIKGVNFYPSQLESILMKHPQIANHYQIVLEKSKGRDTITLMIETRGNVSQSLSEEIAMQIYDLLGFHVDKLDLLPEGTLPRAPGKAVRVVDKR
ncbi:MAG: phenylacetate--CoA ligase [Desulfobacterota bacterium]|nr:phenylacetate--CoA ligase [Thermodesulfobacteriota bacterium]